MAGALVRQARWPGQDLNLRATDYESAALTAELPGREVSEATTVGGWQARAPGRSGTLPGEMLITADSLGQTLALLATFLGIGILVNLLIVYIIAQVLGERRQNQERRARF